MQFVIEVALALVAALVVDLIKYLLRKRSKPPVNLRRRIWLAALVGVGLAILLGASDFTPIRLGETLAVWILGPPEDERLMSTAWQDYKQHRWNDAVSDSDTIIKRFRKVGSKIERDLEQSNAPSPPEGSAGPWVTIDIMKRDPLNFLAAAYWINGQAFEQINQPERARAAYCSCIALKYARIWDPHGWIIRGWAPSGIFWSPSERAEDDLADLARSKNLDGNCESKGGEQ